MFDLSKKITYDEIFKIVLELFDPKFKYKPNKEV